MSLFTKLQSDLRFQFKRTFPTILKIYLPVLILLLITKIQVKFTGFPLSYLLADPYEITDLTPFLGFISNLGVLIWFSTAAICLFTAYVIKSNRSTKRNWHSFLLFSSLITLLLGNIIR